MDNFYFYIPIKKKAEIFFSEIFSMTNFFTVNFNSANIAQKAFNSSSEVFHPTVKNRLTSPNYQTLASEPPNLVKS